MLSKREVVKNLSISLTDGGNRALPRGNEESLDNWPTQVNQGKHEPGGIHIHNQFNQRKT